MHCTGSAYLFAALGADGGARAIGGGVRRSAGAAVGEGGSGVVRIGVDCVRSGDDGGGGVRGVGDELGVERGIRTGVERGNRTGGGGESRRGMCWRDVHIHTDTVYRSSIFGGVAEIVIVLSDRRRISPATIPHS
jgi:hypothetical protein